MHIIELRQGNKNWRRATSAFHHIGPYIWLMNRFERALQLVLEHEGGYANHPDDPGGETYKGIARRFWPNEPIWAIVDEYKKNSWPQGLTKALERDERLNELVRQFYLTKFWNAVRGDDLPTPIAEYVFDFAVNAGVATATRALQRVLGVGTDGIIGPITLAAAQRADAGRVMLKFYRERVRHYINIVQRSPKLGVFLLGWLNRTEAVYRVLTLYKNEK